MTDILSPSIDMRGRASVLCSHQKREEYVSLNCLCVSGSGNMFYLPSQIMLSIV